MCVTITPHQPIRIESWLHDDSPTLQIGNDMYAIERVELPDDSCAVQHVRLVKCNLYGDRLSGVEAYDVALLDNGYYDCTCADHIYRSGPEGRLCKHLQACVDNELLGRPAAWSQEDMDAMDAAYAARERYEQLTAGVSDDDLPF